MKRLNLSNRIVQYQFKNLFRYLFFLTFRMRTFSSPWYILTHFGDFYKLSDTSIVIFLCVSLVTPLSHRWCDILLADSTWQKYHLSHRHTNVWRYSLDI